MKCLDVIKSFDYHEIVCIIEQLYNFSPTYLNKLRVSYDKMAQINIKEDNDNYVIIMPETNIFFVSRQEVKDKLKNGPIVLWYEGNRVEHYSCEFMDWSTILSMNISEYNLEKMPLKNICAILVVTLTWGGLTEEENIATIEYINEKLLEAAKNTAIAFDVGTSNKELSEKNEKKHQEAIKYVTAIIQ